MNIIEMKEKRSRLVSEAVGLVTADMTAETRSRIDAIYAEADQIASDISRAERAAALEAEMRSFDRLPASKTGADASLSESAEVRAAAKASAFDKYMRHGVRSLNDAELRTMSAATGSAGGYTVPTNLGSSIEEALKFYGGMRAAATIFKTSTGAVLNWPTSNDTNQVGEILSGTASTQDVAFGTIPFGAYTYSTKQLGIQKELLQDSSFNLEAFIKSKFVERIGRIQNTHFTVGTGTNQPWGIVPTASVGVTALTGGATSVTYNNLVDLVHSVDLAYRSGAKFMFHDTTLAALRKLVDTQGRPLLGLGLNGEVSDSILGYKYVVNNDMPVLAANNRSILFGELAKYHIRDSSDISILRADELGMMQNQVLFVGFTRADGNLVDAGTRPVKAFVNSAS